MLNAHPHWHLIWISSLLHYMMVSPFFYVSSFLLILLIRFLPSLHPLLTLASDMRLVFVLLCKELYYCSIHWLKSSSLFIASMLRVPSKMYAKKKVTHNVENVEEDAMSVLDLPDLALENMLGRLSPAGLCNMALVCSSMRDWCKSDHLWERHMREKWGRIIGKAACREWQRHVASRKESHGDMSSKGTSKGWIKSLSCLWPLSWLRSNFDSGWKMSKPFCVDPIMSWYLALENGRFWFPAQVHNRENGHVGFMLSCYDADLSYDRWTDTFYARYPPHGRRNVIIEDGVTWDRIRVSPVNTPANNLYVSDCMNDLQPGDHIEIQWRRNKEFPYGWWYGVVGHMTSCDQNELRCRCRNSDTVVLEFNHYATGSRWRQAFVSRKDHQEEGNETDGFYGGIRKIQNKEEILMWKKFWPNEILD